MSKDMSIEELIALRDAWYSEAEKQTVETLPAFIQMLNKYHHTYDTVIYATNAAALAASWVIAKYHGITGFQASAVMWEYMQQWGCYLEQIWQNETLHTYCVGEEDRN